jgi:hypothetical protein
MAYTPVPSELDDSAFGVGIDHVSPVGFLCDETGTDSVDEGDIGLARMSADRRQVVVAHDVSTTGNLTAVNQVVTLDLNGQPTCRIQSSGVFSAQAVVEITVNGSTWLSTSQSIHEQLNFPQGFLNIANQTLIVSVGGAVGVRMRCSSYTSGTMTLTMRAGSGSSIAVGTRNLVNIQDVGTGAVANIPSIQDGMTTIAAGLRVASQRMLYSGGTSNLERTPNVYRTVAAAAAGNTAVWTPTAGLWFRLMRYLVEVTGDATQAAGGVLTITLFDGAAGVTNQVLSVYVPAAALNTHGVLYSSGWITLDNGFRSVAVNNVLNVNLSAALTAGAVRVLACGNEEG